MRLSIRHRTVYHYDTPAEYAAQLLRVTPKPYDGFEVLSWRVSTQGPGRLCSFEDGFGNVTHMLTLAGIHDSLDVTVEGIVETSDTEGVVRGSAESLPPGAYQRFTPLTTPSAAITALALEAAGTKVLGVVKPEITSLVLHRLLDLVHERIAYLPGSTTIDTTAAEALAGGHGVCQDHAHVFVTAARLLGIPARYVGGYLCLEGHEDGAHNSENQEAGHAWAEALDPLRGWTSFDPANGLLAGPLHVRTSIGLDYATASPVRGIRRGVGGETLQVGVQVARLARLAVAEQ